MSTSETEAAPREEVPRERRWFVRSLAVLTVVGSIAPPRDAAWWADPTFWAIWAALLALLVPFARMVWHATRPNGAPNLRGRMRWYEWPTGLALLTGAAALVADRWGGWRLTSF